MKEKVLEEESSGRSGKENREHSHPTHTYIRCQWFPIRATFLYYQGREQPHLAIHLTLPPTIIHIMYCPFQDMDNLPLNKCYFLRACCFVVVHRPTIVTICGEWEKLWSALQVLAMLTQLVIHQGCFCYCYIPKTSNLGIYHGKYMEMAWPFILKINKQQK